MLVDANILLYAVDTSSPFHERAREWMESALNGPRRVAIPWASLLAFARTSTHARALRNPLSPAEAWEFIEDWRAAPATWIPTPGRGYSEILGRLIRELDLRGALIADAAVAALCIEHGLAVVSADSDFARFSDVEWINPL